MEMATVPPKVYSAMEGCCVRRAVWKRPASVRLRLWAMDAFTFAEWGCPRTKTETVRFPVPKRRQGMEYHSSGLSSHFFKNAVNKSIGSGRNVVVLCSLAISRMVWR